MKRQHMLSLQHNKTIAVDGPKVQAVVCGSTNFSWGGFFVQSNNALILRGASTVKPFLAAFEDYWSNEPKTFGDGEPAEWSNLRLSGINARVTFSPHGASNALLDTIAKDIGNKTSSSLFFSLAFLYQTPGPILDAIEKVSKNHKIFVYGISDRKVGGLDLKKPVGIPEDPVTGSAHCVLIPYWAAVLKKRVLHAMQISTRGGELFCEDCGDRVRIAGKAVLYLEGTVST